MNTRPCCIHGIPLAANTLLGTPAPVCNDCRELSALRALEHWSLLQRAAERGSDKEMHASVQIDRALAALATLRQSMPPRMPTKLVVCTCLRVQPPESFRHHVRQDLGEGEVAILGTCPRCRSTVALSIEKTGEAIETRGVPQSAAAQ